MRAAVLSDTGRDALRLRDWPEPIPASGEVLVQVAACGVCGHDQADRNGLMGISLPAVLGHEIAGTVAALGRDVTGFSVGDRVASRPFSSCGACAQCSAGRDLRCAEREFVYGGFAEYAAVKATALAAVPDCVTMTSAAVAGCAVGTVLQALRAVAKVQSGEHVLVTGATGGLGLHGLQVVRAMGAIPVALTSSDDKADKLRELGFEQVITTSAPDYWKAAMDITGGSGVDAVLDNVGHPTLFPGAFRSLGYGGRYVFTGQVARERISFYARFLLSREIVLTGSGGATSETLRDALTLVGKGLVRPVVQTYSLDEMEEAFDAVARHQVLGRAVLRIP